MFSFWLSSFAFISCFVPLILASPLDIVPRKSDTERVSELCIDAFKAIQIDKYYLSQTRISKFESTGGSRVGTKKFICTAYYECKDSNYVPDLTGVFLRDSYGVKRKIGYGITVPADIGGPSDHPIPKSISSSTSSSKGPKPITIPMITVDPTPVPSPDSASATSIPAPTSSNAVPVPLVADINVDLEIAYARLGDLVNNPGSQEARNEAYTALDKLHQTVKGVRGSAWRGLFGSLNSLINSITSLKDALSGNGGRLSDDQVEKINAAKEDLKRKAENVNTAPTPSGWTPTAPDSTKGTASSSQAARTSDTSPTQSTTASPEPSFTSEEQCALPTPDPDTYENDPNSERVIAHNITDNDKRNNPRAVNKDRSVSICFDVAGSAPDFESYHSNPAEARMNPYPYYYTHTFSASSLCNHRLRFDFTKATGPSSRRSDYATEHIYELQLLNQFILWLGWHSDAVADYYGLPTEQQANDMLSTGRMTEQERQAFGNERTEKLCKEVKSKLLKASNWPNDFWYKSDHTKPVIHALLERLSSHAGDLEFLNRVPPSPDNTEFVYLDAPTNGLKAKLFQLQTPTIKHGYVNKLEILARASSLFAYLNEAHVVRVWGAVSDRVHKFYQEMDKVKTSRSNWVLGKINWADEYVRWEDTFLRAAERRYRDWFVGELNMVMEEVKMKALKNDVYSNQFQFLLKDIEERIKDNGDGSTGFGTLSASRISLANLRNAREDRYGMETD
ncbi:hypothetical protein N0V90_012756 [Kalmusia sp. IMI 367209]|nr:hypothetical protein N0V90_012756 [Kalmusia sp. IMI 367209]